MLGFYILLRSVTYLRRRTGLANIKVSRFPTCQTGMLRRHAARQYLHLPKRTHWCGQDEVHALVYHPTHEYWASINKWVTPTSITLLSGRLFDLFVNRKNFVCYAGIYALHSMRDVHPPGSSIPPDVSPVAISYAAGAAGELSHKIVEGFPDGQIKVECFGLQCLGFDQDLYVALRQRFQASAGDQSKKRRADSRDLRAGGHAKLRPQ
ncbi:hypothetical protein B0H11DRAFT_1754783 [Mycena galericulata]|nr:hypothetical protein B0H11DRAFT_1754783 [Mycena galericulata]